MRYVFSHIDLKTALMEYINDKKLGGAELIDPTKHDLYFDYVAVANEHRVQFWWQDKPETKPETCKCKKAKK